MGSSMSNSESSVGKGTVSVSFREALGLRSIWLVIVGAVLTLASSFGTWLTVNLSVSGPTAFPIPGTALIFVINGQDATWNSPYLVEGVRIFYVQLLSICLAFFIIIAGVFKLVESRPAKGGELIVAGVVGMTAPASFVLDVASEGQNVSQQVQQFVSSLGPLIKTNYGFTVGPGFVLALLGPTLLIVSGIIELRRKTRRRLSESTTEAPAPEHRQAPSLPFE